MRRISFLFLTGLFILPSILFGGIEWQAQTITKTKDKESKIIVKGYAQKGNVREEFIEVSEKENQLMKLGMYWLYLAEKDEVYIVDPEEKEYFVMNIDSIAKFMGGISQFVKLTILNPKVEVQDLGTEKVMGIDCRHLKINSSYDMETKVMIMKMKTHNEESKELWITTKHLEDVSLNFFRKAFSTGIAELDSLIRNEANLYSNIGFILKSLVISRTSDAKGKKILESITETAIEKIVEKDLNPDLFKLPSDYKQIKLKMDLQIEE